MSTLTETFQPTAQVHFTNLKGFLKVIEADHRNHHLKDDNLSDGPFKFFEIDPDVRNQSFFYIVNNGEIVAIQSIMDSYGKNNGITSMSTNVHPKHSTKGYAKSLIFNVMKHCNTLGKTLEISCFIGDGEKYLMPTYPNLHRQFPELNIAYGMEKVTTNARKPYTLNPASGPMAAYFTIERH